MKWALVLVLSTSSLLILSCKTTKEIKDGKTAYQSKQYAVSAVLLQSDFDKEKEKSKQAEIAYMIGESFRQNNETRESLKWYDKAVELGYGGLALYEMAYGLKKLEKYDLAVRYFEEMLKTASQKQEISVEIRKCQEAQRMAALGADKDYTVTRMDINSQSLEYAPFLYSEDKLIFTSDKQNEKAEIYKWTGRGFSDLNEYDLITSEIEPLSDIINTPQNEGSSAFSKDRSKLFFTRCYDEERDHYCKIMTTDLSDGIWIEPIPAFPMDPQVNYRDPVLIENDSVLIFCSDDPKGFGGTDLYYSVIEEGKWSAPDLMPPNINTIGNERFPTVNDDTLYFSSDFMLGLGGLDIFKTYLKSDNSWSTPINIGAPFNSSYDDTGFIVSPYKKDYVAREGYFSSDRSVGDKDDIFHFILHSDQKLPKKPKDIVVEEKRSENVVMTVLSIKVIEKNFAITDDPNSLILGYKPLESATVVYQKDGKRESLTTDKKGIVLVEILKNSPYDFLVGKKEYLNNAVNYTLSDKDITAEEGIQTFQIEVEIDRTYPNVEISLDNIYYDYRESFIREDAKPALNELYDILTNNPELNIQLSSHTDCRGDDAYNQALSQRRAEAAIAYIIQKGIPSERILAVGYGESNLFINCLCELCTEDEHQLNRRTTFKIIE